MNSIDERIVAMRFENDQFEKGVRESIKTLEELREATDLEGVGSSMEQVGSAIRQHMNFRDVASSATTFTKGLGLLGKAAKTTFNAATWPLKTLGNGLKELGKLTRLTIGLDVANSLVNAGKQVVTAFTIDPIKTGWNEYELKMDSIKTIMTGTVSTYTKAMQKANASYTYSEDDHLEYVKQNLEELNKYADDTIYSFKDMTSNIGKFTNAGIELGTATEAIKGVANAAAHAGQGTQEASRAMYNLSQSLGMGYLGMVDWRSIENANMATLTFKQTLIDIGVAYGKLKKDEKDGKIYLVDEKGLIDKNTEVTAENFRETLNKKWVDTDVLVSALRVYGGDLTKEQIREMGVVNEAQIEQLYQLGQEAKEAATQVRTFSKMYEALKEAAQSGWATTWELVIGDMNEATGFWTGLNDRFSEILNSQAEGRNNLLRQWRGEQKLWNASTGKWEWKAEGNTRVDGRKILMDSLNSMMDSFSSITGSVSGAFKNVFGEFTAEKLMQMTERFKAFTDQFKTWLGSADDSESRLSKIRTGFEGIFSVFKTVGNFVGKILGTILPKGADLFLNIFAGVGSFLKDVTANGTVQSIFEMFPRVFQSLAKLPLPEKLKKIGEYAKKAFTIFKTSLTTLWNSKALSGVKSFVENTWEGIKKIFRDVQSSSIYQSAASIFDNIVAFFRPSEIMGKNGVTYNGDSPFVSWVKNTWADVQKTFEEVQKWEIWGTVGEKIESMMNVFRPITVMGKMGNTYETDSPFVAWVKNTWTSIQTTFEEVKKSEIWDAVGEKIEALVNVFRPITVMGKMGNTYETDSPFVAWVKNTWTNIQTTFEEIRGWSVWDVIGEKIEALVNVFRPITVMGKMGNTYETDSPFVAWVKNTWTSIQTTFEEVKKSEIWSAVGEKIESMVNVFRPITVTGKMGNTWQEDSPFVAWLKTAWEKIQGLLSEIDADSIFQSALSKLGSFAEALLNFVIPSASAEESKGAHQNGSPTIVEAVDTIKQDWDNNKGTLDTVSSEMEEKVGNITGSADPLKEPPKQTDFLTWFVGLGTSIEEGWNKVSSSIESISTSITELVNSVTEGFNSLVSWIEETDWDQLFSNAEGHMGTLLAIFAGFNVSKLIGGTGTFLSGTGKIKQSLGEGIKGLLGIFGQSTTSLTDGVGKLLTGSSDAITNLGKSLGDTISGIGQTFDKTKRIQGASEAALNFAGAIGIMAAALSVLALMVQNTPASYLDMALQIFTKFTLIAALVMGVSNMAGAKSAKLGISALGFSVGLLIMIGAIQSIAKMVDKGVDIGPAILVLTELTALITAFEALSSFKIGGPESSYLSFGNSKSGLIGFAVAIVAMVHAAKQIAEVAKEDPDVLKSVENVLFNLTAMIAGFEALSSFSVGLGGDSVLSFGNSKSGLIGFAMSLVAMVYAMKQLAELPVEQLDRGQEVLSALTLMIGEFEIFKGLGSLIGSLAGGTNQSTGLIGFVVALTSLVAKVVVLGMLPVDKLENGVKILDALSGLINKFEMFKGFGGLLTGLGGFLNDGKVGTGLLGFVGSITALLAEVILIGEMPQQNVQNGLNVLSQLTNMISLFLGVSGVGNLLSSIGDNPVSTAGKVLTLSIFIAGLGALLWEITELSKQNISDEKMTAMTGMIERIAAAISNFAVSAGVALGLFSILTVGGVGQGLLGLAAAIGGFTAIALAMWGVQEALVGIFGDAEVANIKQKILDLGGILEAVFTVLGSLAGALTGSAVGAFEGTEATGAARGLVQASEIAKNIDEDGIGKLETAVKAFKTISESLIGFDPTLFGQLFNGDITLGKFAEYLGQLGDGLQSFNNAVIEIDDWSYLNTGISLIARLVSVLNLLHTDNLDIIDLSTFIYQLEYIYGDSTYMENFLDIYRKIGESFSEGLGDENGIEFNADPLIEAIVASIKSKQDQISEAIRAAIRAGLESPGVNLEGGSSASTTGNATTASSYLELAQSGLVQMFNSSSGSGLTIPVISFPQIPQNEEGGYDYYGLIGELVEELKQSNNQEPLNQTSPVIQNGESSLALIDGMMPVSGIVGIDPSSIDGIVSAIENQGGAIRSAISGLSGTMRSVASAISGIKIVLNTGAIAGAVDKELGRRAELYDRTGVGGYSGGSSDYSGEFK